MKACLKEVRQYKCVKTAGSKGEEAFKIKKSKYC